MKENTKPKNTHTEIVAAVTCNTSDDNLNIIFSGSRPTLSEDQEITLNNNILEMNNINIQDINSKDLISENDPNKLSIIIESIENHMAVTTNKAHYKECEQDLLIAKNKLKELNSNKDHSL